MTKAIRDVMQFQSDVRNRTTLRGWTAAMVAAAGLWLGGAPVKADHSLAHSLGAGIQTEAPEPGDLSGETPSCTRTEVFPPLATDGARLIVLDPDAAPNRPVVLRGYAYAGAPPTGSQPEGQERRLIYCGCQRISGLPTEGIDGGPGGVQAVLRLPDDVPSGHYSVELLEPGADCPVGGAGATCTELTQCLRPSLTVAPGHIAVTLDKLMVGNNSEPVGGHPAELLFTVASASGVRAGAGNAVADFHGAFPAGAAGRSHLTNGDLTDLDIAIPLFSAAEHRLTAMECREECAAAPREDDVAACEAAKCANAAAFNDLIAVGISGVELDTSPDTGWTTLVGAATAALVCYKTGDCLSSVSNASTAAGLGGKLSDILVSLVGSDDSDDLGSIEPVLRADENDWGIDRPPAVLRLGGGATGEIDVRIAVARTPAPSLVDARIVLESLRLVEGYEVEGAAPDACRGADDVALHVQAFFGGASVMAAPIRLPDDGSTFRMRPGDRITLDETVLETRAGAGDPLVTPSLFLSVGVWEEDGALAADLIGYGAETHLFGDLVTNYSVSSEFRDGQGRLLRRQIVPRTMHVNGYAGSDRDCFFGVPLPGSNEVAGRAEIAYRIEADWLVAPRH